MRVKRFKEFLKEEYDTGPKIYKTSYTTMLDVIKRFASKEARFTVSHDGKMKFADANALIHYQIATEDPTNDYMFQGGGKTDRMFAQSAKYAGYVSAKDKSFAIAEISPSGGGYEFTGKLTGKIKDIVKHLEKKGYIRLSDGDWPR